ncbi:hypothetical protein HUU62_02155 [Rhodoferax sp. 4810]|uniref:STAS domain-containing protein n=1 Tax=Thiospirillum jenense TaxID=1653858 RepID=A0A839H245_9GAMM|nr:hypothetical protein [Thiospirillum jenense]MBB1073216.1 hypothetical protein [Rhodoferax jenense]MBB1124623.1 hypothetical protein [Thiospirillum jenense]
MLELTNNTAIVTDVLAVEDAEPLLVWLQQHPHGKVDLSGCTHLHSATLQVLMAAQPTFIAWPPAADLAAWLQVALKVNTNVAVSNPF